MPKSDKKHRKARKSCACCGKNANGHDVVRADHAIDFVKKQGFEVMYFALPWEEDKPDIPPKIKPSPKILGFAGIFAILLSMLPLTSAATFTGGLTLDLAQQSNWVFLVLAIGLAITLFFFRKFTFSSLILLVVGFLLLMNGLNFLLALIPILASVIIAMTGGGSGH